ncbi:MAG: hypothetical protein RR359_01530 [Bacilli bacterium]
MSISNAEFELLKIIKKELINSPYYEDYSSLIFKIEKQHIQYNQYRAEQIKIKRKTNKFYGRSKEEIDKMKKTEIKKANKNIKK